MAYIVIVAMLALLQFLYFSLQVGRARRPLRRPGAGDHWQ